MVDQSWSLVRAAALRSSALSLAKRGWVRSRALRPIPFMYPRNFANIPHSVTLLCEVVIDRASTLSIVHLHPCARRMP
jgi:hypothetical protein